MNCRMRVWGMVFLFLMGGALGGYAQTDAAVKILSQVTPGVLAVIIYGSDGAEMAKCSAAVVDEDVVVTAYHMIARASDAEVMNAKGKKFRVDGVVGADKARDIVLLKVKGKFPPLPPGVMESIKDGDRVFAVGTNESGMIGISEGMLRRSIDLGGELKIMEYSLSASEQYQGGPVLNEEGQAVGVFMTLARNIRIGLPFRAATAIRRSTKPVPLKEYPKENYLETFDGASLAGRAAYAFDETSAAAFHLGKAVELDPSFILGLTLLAAVRYKQRDFEGSAAALGRILAIEPDKAEIHYSLGRAYAAMRKLPEAVSNFERAVALGLPDKEVFFEIGSACENMGDWAKAAYAYEKFLTGQPDMAWNTWMRLGACRVKMKQFDAGVAAFAEAEKVQPNDVKIKVSLADAYEQAGQLEKAEEIYYGVAVLNPKEARRYYMQVIRIYDAAGRQDKAVTAANKIIELEPGNQDNYYNLGLMFFKAEKNLEAIDAFKKCLGIDPGNAYAWFQIGSAEFNRNNYKEAIAAYKKYVELKTDDPGGWLSIGVSYMYLKDYESALEPLKRSIALRPDNGPALFNLGVCYLKLHDEFSAREIQKKLVGIDPLLADKLDKALK